MKLKFMLCVCEVESRREKQENEELYASLSKRRTASSRTWRVKIELYFNRNGVYHRFLHHLLDFVFCFFFINYLDNFVVDETIHRSCVWWKATVKPERDVRRLVYIHRWIRCDDSFKKRILITILNCQFRSIRNHNLVKWCSSSHYNTTLSVLV